LRERTKEAFLAHIASDYRDDDHIDPEHVTRVVFQVMGKHVTGGEMRGIIHALPSELRNMWAG
jgi:uncharacterized protein (DUF2267 family)